MSYTDIGNFEESKNENDLRRKMHASMINDSEPQRKVIVLKNLNKAYDVTQLKQSLDAWKLILLQINNIVEWERKIDPILIFILNTLIFGMLMFYNPSILTTISILGLTLLVLESIVPIIMGYLFKSVEWDPVSESKYTRICERISNFHQYLINLKLKLESIRKEKQPLYFLLVFFFLVFCAYVGQSVDNLLLSYLGVLFVTLTPGARRHNLVQKAFNKIKSTLGMSSKKIDQINVINRNVNSSNGSFQSIYDSNKRK